MRGGKEGTTFHNPNIRSYIVVTQHFEDAPLLKSLPPASQCPSFSQLLFCTCMVRSQEWALLKRDALYVDSRASVRLWCIWRLEVCMVVLRCALAFMCLWLLQCMPDKEGRHLYIDKETSAWLEDIGRGCTQNLWCVCSQAWLAYCGLSGEHWVLEGGGGQKTYTEHHLMAFDDFRPLHTHQPWSGRDDLYSGSSGNKNSNSWTLANIQIWYVYIYVGCI